MNEEVQKFYEKLHQEIRAIQRESDEGDTREQVFTRVATSYLADSGVVENVNIAYDEKYSAGKMLYKINGYAFSEDFEKLNLFISIYNIEDTIQTLYKADVVKSVNRLKRYFHVLNTVEYIQDLAASHELFQLAYTIQKDERIKHLHRVHAYILTNSSYKGQIPEAEIVDGCEISFQIIDINYLYRISDESRMPIDIEIGESDLQIPCLASEFENTDYEVYVAVIPGQCLVDWYKRFDTRLLEQNVRVYLKTSKINTGMQRTILQEPHRFLAYNNGITATADGIELDETGRYIKKISNLQIVNGGQTTASLYYAAQGGFTRNRTRADLSNVFVQAKFSVVKKKEEYGEIVADISKYSNTQNKVNAADFEARTEAFIQIERLSSTIMTPVKDGKQTYWFFERARGKYDNFLNKASGQANRRVLEDLYPKSQRFTKVELAKYINAYEDFQDGKSYVGPHTVVNGNEKSFHAFIRSVLPRYKDDINNVFFEDLIAKAILFKTADKRHGTKRDPYNIGTMKQVCVPYAIGILKILTEDKLDLYKIWLNQAVSPELSDILYSLMQQINDYIVANAEGTHFIEWAKREACWRKLKLHTWDFDIDSIKYDLINENTPERVITTEDKKDKDTKERIEYIENLIKDIPIATWRDIEYWLSAVNLHNLAASISNIIYKVQFGKRIDKSNRRNAMLIFEKVCLENKVLLRNAGPIAQEEARLYIDPNDITLKLLEEMYDWDMQHDILEDKDFNLLEDVVNEHSKITKQKLKKFARCLKELRKAGFEK